jgi:uncharacterized protein (DUF2267 family)
VPPLKKTEFLAQVQAAGALASTRDAERWSRAVLTALADLAPDSETRRQFITQLPGFLKTPLRDAAPRGLLMDHEALLQRIGAELDVHAPEAERALTSVWRVVRTAISAGEIADFQARIPDDVRSHLARVA